MRKATKIWLIAATSAILLGIILFVGTMTMLKWDFTKLSTSKYVTNHHTPDSNYANILIVTKTADITLVTTEGEQKRIKLFIIRFDAFDYILYSLLGL